MSINELSLGRAGKNRAYVDVWLVVLVHVHFRELLADLNHCSSKHREDSLVIIDAGYRLLEEVGAYAMITFTVTEEVWLQRVMVDIGVPTGSLLVK